MCNGPALQALCSTTARRLNFSLSGGSESLEANVTSKAYTKMQLEGAFYCIIVTPAKNFMDVIQSGAVQLDEGRLRFHLPPVLAKDVSKFQKAGQKASL